jgi:hypothetical protein
LLHSAADRSAIMKPVIVENQDELRALIRDRITELNTTYAAVGALAGLSDDHLAKLLAPTRIRKFGAQSLPLVLQALALRMVRIELIEDDAMAAKMRPRWTQRRRQRPPTRRTPEPVQQCIVTCSKQDDLFPNKEERIECRKTNG